MPMIGQGIQEMGHDILNILVIKVQQPAMLKATEFYAVSHQWNSLKGYFEIELWLLKEESKWILVTQYSENLGIAVRLIRV